MYLTRLESRYFLTEYVDEYVVWLRQTGARVGRRSSEAFARTAKARQLLETLTSRVEARFKEKENLSRADVMQLMNVSSMTVTQWNQKNVVPMQRAKLEPKRYRGKQPRDVLVISSKALRKVMVWCLPPIQGQPS